MKKNRFIDYNSRLDEALAHCKRKCKCGHVVCITPSKNREYIICTWCGGRIYFDENKQTKYDKRVAKNDFMYQLNKCLNKNKEEKNMKRKRPVSKSKLKRKYFNNNADYFTFCKKIDITIYIVEYADNGKIKVYYGAKLGRPRKDANNESNRYKRNMRGAKKCTKKKYI